MIFCSVSSFVSVHSRILCVSSSHIPLSHGEGQDEGLLRGVPKGKGRNENKTISLEIFHTNTFLFKYLRASDNGLLTGSCLCELEIEIIFVN